MNVHIIMGNRIHLLRYQPPTCMQWILLVFWYFLHFILSLALLICYTGKFISSLRKAEELLCYKIFEWHALDLMIERKIPFPVKIHHRMFRSLIYMSLRLLWRISYAKYSSVPVPILYHIYFSKHMSLFRMFANITKFMAWQ